MSFIAKLCYIEIDSLILIITIAASVTAAAVSIAEGHTTVTRILICLFHFLVISQLVHGIFIFKFKFTLAPYLAALDSDPGSLRCVAIMAQITHPLQQRSAVAPGMIR